MKVEVSIKREGTWLPLLAGQDGCFPAEEGSTLRVSVVGVDPARGWLSGIPLDGETVVRIGSMLRTTWTIPIHVWAGRSTISIELGHDRHTIPLDVAPHPGKLGVEAFREMLDELIAVHKDLVVGASAGSAPATRTTDSPSLVLPGVLDAELPGLLSALQLMAAQPLTQIERIRRRRRLAIAQRVDTQSLRWIAARPQVGQALRLQREGEPADLDVDIDTPHVQTTIAHPATRYVRYALERLVRVLDATLRQLAHVSGGAGDGHRDELVQARAEVAAKRIDGARTALRGWLRRFPLSEVEPLGPTPAAVQAVVDHPVYARIQRVIRRLLDPGALLDEEGLLDIGLRRTHELFEILVSYRIAEDLQRHLGPGWTFQLAQTQRSFMLVSPPNGLMWSARGPDGKRLELLNQQTFRSWPPPETPGKFTSLSAERRPDHVLTCAVNGTPRWWLILDSKYRASRPAIHEGLADVHVYRDALRWCGMPCRGAYIVVPTLAQNASCYGATDYLASQNFGALVLGEVQWGEILDGVGG